MSDQNTATATSEPDVTRLTPVEPAGPKVPEAIAAMEGPVAAALARNKQTSEDAQAAAVAGTAAEGAPSTDAGGESASADAGQGTGQSGETSSAAAPQAAAPSINPLVLEELADAGVSDSEIAGMNELQATALARAIRRNKRQAAAQSKGTETGKAAEAKTEEAAFKLGNIKVSIPDDLDDVAKKVLGEIQDQFNTELGKVEKHLTAAEQARVEREFVALKKSQLPQFDAMLDKVQDAELGKKLGKGYQAPGTPGNALRAQVFEAFAEMEGRHPDWPMERQVQAALVLVTGTPSAGAGQGKTTEQLAAEIKRQQAGLTPRAQAKGVPPPRLSQKEEALQRLVAEAKGRGINLPVS
jgi:hypothetical protein